MQKNLTFLKYYFFNKLFLNLNKINFNFFLKNLNKINYKIKKNKL